MKKYFLLLLLLISLFSFSQNNGQSNYNDLIRIDYFGYSGGAHVFKIKNLQPCPMVANYTLWGSAQINSINIFAYEDVFVSFQAPQPTVLYVRAKATTYCGVPAPDRGWVESQSSASPVLSKVLSNVSVNRISPNKIEVMFTASETSNIKKYNIRISEDGTTYKTVKVIVPNGLTQDKTYRVILNQ